MSVEVVVRRLIFARLTRVDHGTEGAVRGLRLDEQITRAGSGFFDSQALGHLFVEKTLARPVRLKPFAVDYELRDCPLSGLPHDFFRRTGSALDVDFAVREAVFVQEALGFPTVRAPEGGV